MKPTIEQLRVEEEARLSLLRKDPASPYCAPIAPTREGRRHFLFGALALAGSAGARASSTIAQGADTGGTSDIPADPTKVPGTPLDDRSYGTRSRFETEVRVRMPTRTPYSSQSMTPLERGFGIITPSGLHFERSHAGTAQIDPRDHRVYVHGMVRQAKKFSMADLRRLPSLSRILFIECSGNTATEWAGPMMKTVQGTHGATSVAEWTGVRLATILEEAGLRPGARWLLAEGGDAAQMARSIPIEKALADCFLAYGQNGEALRPEQGYPLRLIVPGYEGNVHIKWLRRIEVSDQPFMTREETSKYTDLMPGGKAVQFSFEMEAKSVITFPSGEMMLDGPGFYEVTGLAWSGRGAVRGVEVSGDGGRTWAPAELQQPVLPVCHTRFRFPWRWDGREAILQSRCVDETGYRQPTLKQLVAARGIYSVYHLNAIQSWRVAPDGRVSNVHPD